MKNLASTQRQVQPQYREPSAAPRPTRLPAIILDAQRHIVEIRDPGDDTTRQYIIETARDSRNHYSYLVTFKPKWETTQQQICMGSEFNSPDQAIEDALFKIDAWERWLDASRPRFE